VRPLLKLIHELAQWEIDLLGKVGNRNIHQIYYYALSEVYSYEYHIIHIILFHHGSNAEVI